MKPVYEPLPVIPLPRPFSLRELARDTAELGAITLFGWGLLELVRAL